MNGLNYYSFNFFNCEKYYLGYGIKDTIYCKKCFVDYCKNCHNDATKC